MPIITFLQDIFSIGKGPYHRKIGRHTQRFCSKAVKRSANELQKKTFFIAAICADELVSTLVGLADKRQLAGFNGRTVQPKLARQQIVAALRVYLSAILTLTSSQKELLLQTTELQEQELLQAWCWIFEYAPADMQLFDNEFLPSYQQQGLEGLSRLAGTHLMEYLFEEKDVLSPLEMENLQSIMLDDVQAIVRVLQKGKVAAV